MYKKILNNKELFVPIIFTEKQFKVIEKVNNKIKLSNAEKKAFYTSINKKMKALESFEKKDNEYYIQGSNEIISERLSLAKNIIDEYSGEKVFVSGSFLYSKKYNDIDIFIITKRGYKESVDGDRHIIYLSEKKLLSSVFQSASLISVSNFQIQNTIKIKNLKLNELMSIYHESIIENIQKADKKEATRNLVFNYYLICENKLLNGKELKNIVDKTKNVDINIWMKKISEKLFSKSYLYVAIHEYIKTLDESIKNITPNNHLLTYKETYEELIYGRNTAETS